MTLEQLAALPLGAIVLMTYDDGTLDEEGEIVQAGQTVHIMWPSAGVTNIIDTNAKGWAKYVKDIKAENENN